MADRTRQIKRATAAACLAVLLSLITAGAARAALQLNLGSATGEACDQVTLAITLQNESGTSVSATSNDIAYSSQYLTVVSASLGPAAEAAGKSIIQNAVSNGLYRVGVVSMANLNAIPDGIVAYVTFEIDCGAPETFYSIQNTPSGSTPQGDPVDVSGTSGTITVSSGT
ncbi:cohesin domain-containing protein [Thermodesulfobacteriota bacterium]